MDNSKDRVVVQSKEINASKLTNAVIVSTSVVDSENSTSIVEMYDEIFIPLRKASDLPIMDSQSIDIINERFS